MLRKGILVSPAHLPCHHEAIPGTLLPSPQPSHNREDPSTLAPASESLGLSQPPSRQAGQALTPPGWPSQDSPSGSRGPPSGGRAGFAPHPQSHSERSGHTDLGFFDSDLLGSQRLNP